MQKDDDKVLSGNKADGSEYIKNIDNSDKNIIFTCVLQKTHVLKRI